jgi:hypothetical protein
MNTTFKVSNTVKTKKTLAELIEHLAGWHAQPRVPSVWDSYSRHFQVEELATEKKTIVMLSWYIRNKKVLR